MSPAGAGGPAVRREVRCGGMCGGLYRVSGKGSARRQVFGRVTRTGLCSDARGEAAAYPDTRGRRRPPVCVITRTPSAAVTEE